MDAELKQIVETMTGPLAKWLDKPGKEAEKIEEIRRSITEAKGMLGAGFLSGAMKELEQSEAAARRARQHQAAKAIAELCREHGIILDPKEPPKRKRRASKNKGVPKAHG